MDIREEGLKFEKLEMNTMRMVIISEAAFGNSPGYRSQLLYLILSSQPMKPDQITRSVQVAEVHNLVFEFSYAFILRDMVEDVLVRRLKI